MSIRDIIEEHRRKRALRLAIRGLTLLRDALVSQHLPRPVRRRLLREVTSGRIDPTVLMKERNL